VTPIEVAYQLGTEAWPSVHLSRDRFDALCKSAGVGEAALRARPEEIYLAYAAGDAELKALTLLDENFIARLSDRLRRWGTASDVADDVLQTVRERLFVGQPPRIRDYDGSIPLASWIRIIGVRVAIDLHRAQSPPSRTGQFLPVEAADSMVVGTDTATLLAKVEYKARFEAALRAELANLSPRVRTVFHLHVLEGLSLEEIGRRHGVHRVTVARWVWGASDAVLAGLRRTFKDNFGVIPQELDSLINAMRSQLSVGLDDIGPK
jgi:RNA polymerase sigma-70 factor (ECF subfamily)